VSGLSNDVRQILPRPIPVAMATKFNIKIAFNSSCIRDISEMLASNRGFPGIGYQMMSGPAMVAMATKFDTKPAITPLVCKISWCRLRLVGGIRGCAIE